MGTHAQQDFMKFLYFQKKKLWYNIANGAYYTAPICSERQRGNLHYKWCASPGGAIAKLWHNIAKGAYYTAPICSERTARKSPLKVVRIPRRGHSEAMA